MIKNYDGFLSIFWIFGIFSHIYNGILANDFLIDIRNSLLDYWIFERRVEV